MSELLKVEVKTMEVKSMEVENNEKKPRKFKPENQCVELTTMEVRLVMGGADNQNSDRWWVSWWSICGREGFDGGLGNGEETGKV